MLIWDLVLWSYFVASPIYVILTYKNLKQQVTQDPSIRPSLYTSTVIGLWAPVALMLGYQQINQGFAPALNFVGTFNTWWFGIAVALMVLIGYLALSINKLRSETKNDQAILEGIDNIKWLLPANRLEANRFVFAVSPTAGICEEILYRGLLLGMLSSELSVVTAVIISSIAFGAPHLYQGWLGFIKTALLGFVMAMITVLSESLILAIIFHTVIDVYMGLLSYLVISRQNQISISETAESF
jgi:membrane protease YdiL (CAAX protease family)